MTKVGPTSRFARGLMNALRGLCLLMIPIAAYAPAVIILLENNEFF